MSKAIGSIVVLLLLAVMAMFGGGNLSIMVSEGERSPDFEAPVIVSEGELAPDFEAPVIVSEGELAPDFEAPVIRRF